MRFTRISCLLALGASLLAQSDKSTIRGTITDPTGVVSDFGAEKHNARRIAFMLRVEF